MEAKPQIADGSGFPELTHLGKRIEMLRIERGLSKQHLARYAGTSRQQLWRVMTGKSELTGTLRSRLADVLNVTALEFDMSVARAATTGVIRTGRAALSVDFEQYLGDPASIARTLATMPAGDAGRSLKRRLLDSIEDMALGSGSVLDAQFFDLRRRVLSGEL
jgi:transcriptional regulator with XRE-family HTH domain